MNRHGNHRAVIDRLGFLHKHTHEREKCLNVCFSAARDSTGLLRTCCLRKLGSAQENFAGVGFGRCTRVYQTPLLSTPLVGAVLCQRMWANLHWWLRFLDVLPERRIPAAPSPTVCVALYADATCHGRVAWVAVCSGQRLFARSTLPSALRRWVHRRRQQVATWELVAAL